jgi:hypothetical protein
MALRSQNSALAHAGSRLWLAARDGVRLSGPTESIGPADGPEAPLEVEFVGLTEAEQRAALAAFPGGRRFVLKSTH